MPRGPVPPPGARPGLIPVPAPPKRSSRLEGQAKPNYNPPVQHFADVATALVTAVANAAADASRYVLGAALAANSTEEENDYCILAVPRAATHGVDFEAARLKEYNGLVEKGVMKAVSRRDVPVDATVVETVPVETVKRDGTAKARQLRRRRRERGGHLHEAAAGGALQTAACAADEPPGAA